MRRREIIAGAGCVTISALAGCLGVAGLDEHEATPAGVDPAVREDTGYEFTGIDDRVIQEPVDVAGVSDEVTVVNYLTEYEKSIDLGPLGSAPAAMFMILTSPQISIAGQAFNPINEMSSNELVGLLEAELDEIENVDHVTDRTVTILEQETSDAVFDAEVDVDGFTVDMHLHVTEAVQTTNDHLVTIGVYPKQVQHAEEDNITAMMGGVVEQAE